VLGLGTANFGRRLAERERRRLLETAFDVGIRHIDTAPLYGDGSAELSVGRFLARRRDDVTVVAKVGIAPPRGGRAAPVLRRLGRGARPIAPKEARASLERTLRALRTDRVDVLLLHECSAAALDEGWRAFLEDSLAAGRARATGIATNAAESEKILAAAGDDPFPAIAQVAAGTPVPLDRGAIFHSVFASGATIAEALAAHPRSVVLFATTSAERLVANARLAG
jgi:aryl-alcohol dehydrogenase-like predicted oxidoreductase